MGVLNPPAIPSRFNRGGLASAQPAATPALAGVTWTYSDVGSATYSGRVDRCDGTQWVMIVPPSGTYASKGGALPGPTLYKPGGARRARVAIADAKYTKKNLIILGDSRALGAGSDNSGVVPTAGNATYDVNAMAEVLRGFIVARIGIDPGIGWVPLWDHRWAFTGSTFAQREWGPLNFGGRQLSPGTGNFATLTLPAGTTSTVIPFWDGSGKYNVGVDAGALTEHTPGGTQAVNKLTQDVTGGAALKVAGGSTTNFYFQGAICNTAAAAGLQVHRVGYAGADTGLATALSGSSVNGTFRAANAALTAHIMQTTFDVVTPDIVAIWFDVNDWSQQAANNITPALFAANLQRLITEATVTRSGCVLLINGPAPVPAAATFAIDDYQAAAKALCDTNDHVSWLNIGDLWGTQAQAEADGLSIAGSVHPKRPGHWDIARILFEILFARGLSQVAYA